MSQKATAVTPHFVVAIINESVIIRCLLSPGAVSIASEMAELPRADLASSSSATIRCMLYSPNLVADEYPHFAWDAEVEIDSTTHFVGTVARRCEVIHSKWSVPPTARRIRLRLHRLRLASVRSRDSDLLAQHVVTLFHDEQFNPRSGSLPLQVVAEAVQTRFSAEFRKVIGGEHLGSFRAFLVSHEDSFAIFHYRDKEISNRNLPIAPHDERVAIRKEVRDTSPPMLPPGHSNNNVIVQLLKDALKDQDSQVHRLLRTLSHKDVFRIGMSAAFSSLMHWLQRHRHIFCWSTDPQQVCTIGLLDAVPSTAFPRLPVLDEEVDSEDGERY